MEQSIYLFSLLSLLLFMGGCNDEEEMEQQPYYYTIEDEVVTEELNNVAGYAVWTELDCVFICYSEYADEYAPEYFKDGVWNGEDEEILNDLQAHMVGVSREEFEKRGVRVPCKVYFSASVTNNNKVVNYGPTFNLFWLDVSYKAYLQDVKQRN